MKLNLDALKDNILEQLQAEGFVVFHGFCRSGESRPMAYWDTTRTPSFRPFWRRPVRPAPSWSSSTTWSSPSGMVDDAMDQLEEYDLPVEERRGFERRLREMQRLPGIHLRAGTLLRLRAAAPTFTSCGPIGTWTSCTSSTRSTATRPRAEDEDGEEDSMGGYFSRN